jgi:cytochrome P450
MAPAETITDLGALLLTPEGVQDPYAVYRRMREVSPVYWSDAMGAWLVSGYGEVRAVFRDSSRFSNRNKHAANLERLPPEVRAQVPTVELVETASVIAAADQPEHTRQRAPIGRALAPRAVSAKRGWIEELCDELVDTMARAEQPEVIRDLSTPLAYRLILGLFGSPLEHVPVYRDTGLASSIYRTPGGSTVESVLHYEATLVAFRAALESVYADVIEHPDDTSIIGSFLQGEEEVDRDELFVILKQFFAAGQDNLIYTVATTILALLRHPEQLQLVLDDPSLAVDAFEEAVRWEVPTQANWRSAIDDTTVAGQEIAAGDRLLAYKGAANRDPAVWTEPDRFDITRDHNEPPGGAISFGNGIHFCIGAGVARLAGPIAVNALLSRFPDLALPAGAEPRWQNVPNRRQLDALPLDLRR